jgi:hypothetical protein
MGLFRIRGNGSAFSLMLLLTFLFWAAVYYLSQIEWVRTTVQIAFGLLVWTAVILAVVAAVSSALR